jgi:methyltransferase (TIGR00027 family)
LLAEDETKVAPANNEIRVPPRYFSAETYRPALEEAIASLYERFSLEMTAWVVLRKRYAEDKLAQAVSQGVKQYVLFGAGLGTFAFRNRNDDLKVFEIDDPATQQWKRGIIA